MTPSRPRLRQLIALLTSVSVLLAPLAHGQGLIATGEGAPANGVSDTQFDAYRQSSALQGQQDSRALLAPQIRQWTVGDKPASQNDSLRSSPSAPLPPLRPNDFQKFVLESTGQQLPLFGAHFFSQAQSSYVPLANTPVSPDYALGPGDEVLIRGWGSVDVDVKAVVDRNGLIHIPRVGAVSLGGVKSSQAEGVIRTSVGRYYKDFQLSVTLGQLRGITVYVVGQARKPGAYTLSSTSTLISALFASGGPGANGSLRRVQVKRGSRTVSELDLYAFLSRGDSQADVRLQDGDTIVIPAATGYVALTGSVTTPAVYEINGKDDTVDSILALAGGLPVLADPKRATLERIDPSRKPARSVESFALDQAGLQRTLKAGDLLSVQALIPEFGNAITLRGNVDQPVRLPWKDGMRIRDVIPSKGFLMSRASVKRQNEVLLTPEARERIEAEASRQTGQFGGHQPGQPVQFGQPDRSALQTGTEVRENADTLAGRIGNLIDEINLDYAVVERVDRGNVSVQLLPFNLGNALNDAQSPDNLALKEGDIITVFSVNDVRVPLAKRQVFVRVEGEVQRPGIYQMAPGDSIKQLLEQAGGLTPDAYLFGAQFYREEVKRAQAANLAQLVRRLEAQTQTQLSSAAANVSSSENPGVAQLRMQAEARAQEQALDRLRNLNPSGRIMLGLGLNSQPEQLPTLRLQTQDRLVVPARPDFVYVLGSVNTESSLIWREGESVQHYLNQSGLTNGADEDELFVIRADGSVLSRNGSWFSSVHRATVMPGDVIVLPEKTDHESAWSVFTRNAKDITQIIYQFSLGAAAIKTLRE